MSANNPPNSEFKYTPTFEVTDDVKHAFEVNGYILLRGMFSPEEIGLVKSAFEHEDGVMSHMYRGHDRENAKLSMSLWNQPGNDITGIVARSEKLVGTFEKLLGGEVYHYHAKVIPKEARTGGAHLWHQDYGYWYENGCMFPNMGTAWIAVDNADKGNGCLQILEGSQLAGRIAHYRDGDQAEADNERVTQLHKFCPRRYVEVDAGDTLLFHCNVLHRSDKNSSDRRRWAYLVAYNRADNDPVYRHHHPQYTPLIKVPNSAIAECKVVTELEGKDFWVALNEDTHMALKDMPQKPI